MLSSLLRLVRDRLHYTDPIFCGAGRAVQILLEESQLLPRSQSSSNPIPSAPSQCRQRSSLVQYPASTSSAPPVITCQDSVTLGGDTTVGPTYHAVHIRRGDFQYKHTRISAEEVHFTPHVPLSSTLTHYYPSHPSPSHPSPSHPSPSHPSPSRSAPTHFSVSLCLCFSLDSYGRISNTS
jgi:hypothetical protein